MEGFQCAQYLVLFAKNFLYFALSIALLFDQICHYEWGVATFSFIFRRNKYFYLWGIFGVLVVIVRAWCVVAKVFLMIFILLLCCRYNVKCVWDGKLLRIYFNIVMSVRWKFGSLMKVLPRYLPCLQQRWRWKS